MDSSLRLTRRAVVLGAVAAATATPLRAATFPVCAVNARNGHAPWTPAG